MKILVTGSARLDSNRFSGDSLQGRYHYLRLHPLSAAELGIKSPDELKALLTLGGFPEPFLEGSEVEAKRWSREYRNRLLNEDISSLEQIQNLGTLELMLLRLPELVGSPLSINALREDLQVSHKTASRWLDALERFYAIFRLAPFGAPRIRAVKKERKHYHFDWSLVKDMPVRFENMVAAHLLKWVHSEEDSKGRHIELRYFRDVDGREVDFVVVEEGRRFCLCGSSARKLKRSHANLLGGRALRRELLGFSAHELGNDFSILRMLNHGPLPPHYLSDQPAELLGAYVDLYLNEEVLDEGLTRRLSVFSSFLRAAAIGDTEVTNFSNIARECGVASTTVRGYYEELEDTMIGALLPAFTRRPKRRVVHAPKFYFRDVGIVNHLLRRAPIKAGSELFGKAFENWVFHELSVFIRASGISRDISYWRLSSGIEVDFVLDDGAVAIEVKGKERIQTRDTRHLLSFREEYPQVRKRVVVCLENQARKTDDGVLILPYADFLKALWNGDLF